jgi:hypothetical protein
MGANAEGQGAMIEAIPAINMDSNEQTIAIDRKYRVHGAWEAEPPAEL